MEITKTTREQITILSVQGQLDAITAPALERELQALSETGTDRFIVDLGGVQLISSAALRVLLSAAKFTKRQQGQILLCCLTPEVKKVFELSGLTNLFNLQPTLDDALASLGVTDTPSPAPEATPATEPPAPPILAAAPPVVEIPPAPAAPPPVLKLEPADPVSAADEPASDVTLEEVSPKEAAAAFQAAATAPPPPAPASIVPIAPPAAPAAPPRPPPPVLVFGDPEAETLPPSSVPVPPAPPVIAPEPIAPPTPPTPAAVLPTPLEPEPVAPSEPTPPAPVVAAAPPPVIAPPPPVIAPPPPAPVAPPPAPPAAPPPPPTPRAATPPPPVPAPIAAMPPRAATPPPPIPAPVASARAATPPPPIPQPVAPARAATPPPPVPAPVAASRPAPPPAAMPPPPPPIARTVPRQPPGSSKSANLTLIIVGASVVFLGLCLVAALMIRHSRTASSSSAAVSHPSATESPAPTVAQAAPADTEPPSATVSVPPVNNNGSGTPSAPSAPPATPAMADATANAPAADSVQAPASLNLDAKADSNQETRDDVLKRIDAMPLAQAKKDQLYKAVESARHMGRLITIGFDTGRTDLSAAAVANLKKTISRPDIQAIVNDPTVVVVILGFADSKGAAGKNKEISDKRAANTMAKLRDACGLTNVMHDIGMGGSELLAKGNTEKNRVAEVWVVSP